MDTGRDNQQSLPQILLRFKRNARGLSTVLDIQYALINHHCHHHLIMRRWRILWNYDKMFPYFNLIFLIKSP